MKSRAWIIFLIALLAALLVLGRAAAQGANPPTAVTDDQVNVIARQLYCPVCENVPLDVCPTQACIQWRDLIRQKLAQGWTADQIKQYFVAQYGDRVLATPPARGLNWLVYFVPPIAILAGAYLLFRAFKTWKKPIPEVTLEDVKQDVGDEYIMRLEEELKKR